MSSPWAVTGGQAGEQLTIVDEPERGRHLGPLACMLRQGLVSTADLSPAFSSLNI